ncbi:MAG: malonate transporter [Flavobacteriales bacterium]|jgi:malonate transporter
MLAVIELVVPLFAIILLGFVSGKLARLPIEGLAWMNFYIVYAALPALFYQLLSNTPVGQFAQIGFILISIGSTFAIFCLVYLIARWRKNNQPESTIQGLAAAYGNIGYMGIPLGLAAFGPAAAVPVALIFCFENAMHFIVAPLFMALDNSNKQTKLELVRHIMIKIFTHPFIIATIAGVLASVFSFKLPEFANQTLDLLSKTAGPCALFAMGISAALRPLKRVPTELGYIVPIKLILHPVLVYGLLVWLVPDLNPIWLYSAVLLATLPTATNVFVLAEQYGVWQERASSTIVISTLLAMVTVTTFLYLVRSGWL